MNIYQYIVNPETGRKVNINGKIGKKVIKNYINNQSAGGKWKMRKGLKNDLCKGRKEKMCWPKEKSHSVNFIKNSKLSKSKIKAIEGVLIDFFINIDDEAKSFLFMEADPNKTLINEFKSKITEKDLIKNIKILAPYVLIEFNNGPYTKHMQDDYWVLLSSDEADIEWKQQIYNIIAISLSNIICNIQPHYNKSKMARGKCNRSNWYNKLDDNFINLLRTIENNSPYFEKMLDNTNDCGNQYSLGYDCHEDSTKYCNRISTQGHDNFYDICTSN